MHGKIVSVTMLILMITSALALAVNIQPGTVSGTVHLVANGSKDLPATPTQKNTLGAFSVPPETQWSKTYGGTGDDEASALVQTVDGGYALAGSGFANLIKTDANGNVQWSKTYGGTGDDEASALVQTVDGGYAFAGGTRGVVGGALWLVKTDASGNMQWNKRYQRTNDDWANALVQTVDGGYACAGLTNYGASSDAWLVKTDSNGNMLWSKTYGGTGSNVAYALAQTSDGGYVLAGATNSSGAGNYDFWLVKTDASGNMQWSQTYGGTGWDEAHAVLQTSDGGYALAGSTWSSGSWDFWLVKTDASGNMQWSQTYGGTGSAFAFAMVQTHDGGYALTGYSESFPPYLADAWLVKTDSGGNMLWSQTYGGTGNDLAFALVQTVDGGYAFAGWTNSSGAGGWDAWLVKIAPEVLHDIAVDSVVPLQTDVVAGDNVTVNVIVENKGTQTETFSVTGYFGSGKVGFDKTTVTLNAGGTQTLSMLWNTKGVMPSIYPTGAYATPVPGETNLTNNDCTGGYVTVAVSTTWNRAEDPYSQGNYGSAWATGNCYGLSATALLYFMHYKLNNISCPYFPSPNPPAMTTSGIVLPSNTSSLNNASLAVMFHQVYSPNNAYSTPSSEHGNYSKLVVALESGTPAILGMGGSDQYGNLVYHAVVAYAIEPLPDGTVDIALSDPNLPQQFEVANYNPTTDVFSYTPPKCSYSHFITVMPEITQTSWSSNFPPYTYTPSWQTWEWQVAYYDIVFASKPITVEHVIPGVGGSMPQFLMDYFNSPGNSGSFVCGISGSAGIEEGTTQVYAIPNGTSYNIVDPSSSQSTIMITRVEDVSGQLTFFEYLLNASTTQGSLNFTVTPSSQGLSISAGDNGLNASVSFFSATEQSYSSSKISDVQVGQMQTLNLTCPTVTTMTDVSSFKSVVGQGYNTLLNITLTNQNNSTIVSNVTVYCNEENVSTPSSIILPANSSTTIQFDWNTTGFAYGNYTVTAVTDMNYNCTCAQVTVSVAGDINGDGTVNILDAIQVSNSFLAMPGSRNWNPNADINGDNVVNILDAIILAGHFLQHV